MYAFACDFTGCIVAFPCARNKDYRIVFLVIGFLHLFLFLFFFLRLCKYHRIEIWLCNRISGFWLMKHSLTLLSRLITFCKVYKYIASYKNPITLVSFNAFAHLSTFPTPIHLSDYTPVMHFFLSSLVYSNTLPHISFPVSIFLWISLSAPVRFSPHTFLVTFCFSSLVSQYIRQHSLSLTFLDVSINPSWSMGWRMSTISVTWESSFVTGQGPGRFSI